MIFNELLFKQEVCRYFLLIVFLSFVGCIEDEHPGDEVRNLDGVLISKDYIWKKKIREGNYKGPSVSPALYEGNIVLGGSNASNQDMLVALDTENGEEQWRWSDFIKTSSNRLNSYEYGFDQFEDTWIFQSNRDFYALDLKTGSTIWKSTRSEGDGVDAAIQIVDNQYYASFAFYNDTTEVPTLIRGNLNDASIASIVTPPVDSIQYFLGFYGIMREPFVYKEDGELHAFLSFAENVDLYTGKAFNFVASYNITKGDYDFEKTHLGDTVKDLPFSQRPCMYEDLMIVNSHEVLYGVDKYTGDIVWKRTDFEDRGSGMLRYQIHDDKLFGVNVIGSTQHVFALNPQTGSTIWKDVNRGGDAEVIHYLNGVLYFTSRGNGHLYAYDGETGELLWDILPTSNATFTSYGGVRVVPGSFHEKGKVIVSADNGSVYCYEAAK